MGSAGVVGPFVKAAKSAGHEVLIFAEGLASDRLSKEGIELSFRGPVNFLDTPFFLDPVSVLQANKPDYLVIGESEPINLELHFAQAARKLGVKIIEIGDFWGGWVRNPVRPDILGVLDEADAESARRRFGWSVKVVVSGNPGLKPVTIGEDLKREMDELREQHGMVIVYVGGSPTQTGPELELLVQCVLRTPQYCVIPRLHPKYAKVVSPSGKTWGEVWQDILSPIQDRVVSIKTVVPNTDPIACGANLTLSGFSTVSTTVAGMGGKVAMLGTQATMDDLLESSVLAEIPLVALGAAAVVEPMDLTHVGGALSPGKLVPYDPQKLLEAIG